MEQLKTIGLIQTIKHGNIKDIDVFISEIRKGRKAESDSGDDLTTKWQQ